MWGCDPATAGKIPQAQIYQLGTNFETVHCPIRLMRDPFVSRSIQLYADYKNGITPNGRMTEETKAYRQAMDLLASHEAQASAWYHDELDRRKPKRGD